MFFYLFCLATYVTMLLLLWLETNVIYQYFNFKPFRKLFKFEDYEDWMETIEEEISYTKYLSMTSNNFFIKLITCPMCLSFWLIILIGFLFNVLIYIPALYIISLVLFFFIRRYKNA